MKNNNPLPILFLAILVLTLVSGQAEVQMLNTDFDLSIFAQGDKLNEPTGLRFAPKGHPFEHRLFVLNSRSWLGWLGDPMGGPIPPGPIPPGPIPPGPILPGNILLIENDGTQKIFANPFFLGVGGDLIPFLGPSDLDFSPGDPIGFTGEIFVTLEDLDEGGVGLGTDLVVRVPLTVGFAKKFNHGGEGSRLRFGPGEAFGTGLYYAAATGGIQDSGPRRLFRVTLPNPTGDFAVRETFLILENGREVTGTVGFAFGPGGNFGKQLYVSTLVNYPDIFGTIIDPNAETAIFKVEANGTATRLVNGKWFFQMEFSPDPKGCFGEFLYGTVQPTQVDTRSDLARMDPAGNVQILAKGFGSATGIAFGPDGNLYVSDAAQGVIYKITGVCQNFVNIQVKEVLPTKDIEILGDTFTTKPDETITGADSTTLVWNVGITTAGQVKDLNYSLDLKNLKLGDQRTVGRELILSFRDQTGKEFSQTLGPFSVSVEPSLFGLTIQTDKPTYVSPEKATFTTTISNPDSASLKVFSEPADFAQASLSGLDAATRAGKLILQSFGPEQFLPEGTARFILDAGQGARWGRITFTGSRPKTATRFDPQENTLSPGERELLTPEETFPSPQPGPALQPTPLAPSNPTSNPVRDVFVYDLASDSLDPATWRSKLAASWFKEAEATIVDNALSQEDGPEHIGRLLVSDTPALDQDLGSNFTLEGWISGSNFLGNFLVSKGNPFTGPGYSIFKTDFFGLPFITVAFSKVDPATAMILRWTQNAFFTPSPTGWDHVAFTVNNNTAALYINGSQAGQWIDFPGPLTRTLNPFFVGANFESTPTASKIDEVRVYKRTLTSAEVDRSHDMGRQHLPSDIVDGLVGYWNFDPSPKDQSPSNLGGQIFFAALKMGGRFITGRSSKPEFPQKSYIIASEFGLDVIDAATSKLWMRFPTDRAFLWSAPQKPSSLFARNGVIYLGQDSSDTEGLAIIDFVNDKVRNVRTDAKHVVNNPIRERYTNISSGGSPTLPLYTQSVLDGSVRLPHGRIHDVSMMDSGQTNLVALGTNRGLALLKNETVVTKHQDAQTPIGRVFLTSNERLYFSTRTQSAQDSVRVVYDILSAPDNFATSVAYGAEAQAFGTFEFLTNQVNDLFVTAGTSAARPGDNTLYVATPKGLVQFHEMRGSEAEAPIRIYGSSDPLTEPLGVNILAGSSNDVRGVAVSGDELWAGTLGAAAGQGAVSILSLEQNRLLCRLAKDSIPALPSDRITSVSSGLLGTADAGALSLTLGLANPITLQTRSAPSAETLLEAPFSQPFNESGGRVPSPDSRFLEILLTLRTEDPTITPVLDDLIVGYTTHSRVLEVTVEDPQGVKAADVAKIALFEGDFGLTRTFDHAFDTAQVIPGFYRARATILEEDTGQLVATSLDDFEILTVTLQEVLDGSIATNQRAYIANETATIISKVANISKNVPINQASVLISVLAPDQSVIETFSYTTLALPAGGQHARELGFGVGTLAPATYVLRQEVSFAGQLVFTRQASFEVVPSISQSKGIIGTVIVDPGTVEQGRNVTITATAQNTGNTDLTGVTLFVRVHQSPSLETLREFSHTTALAMGASAAASFSFENVQLEPAAYPVTLTAQVVFNNQTMTLGLDVDGLIVVALKNQPPIADAGQDLAVEQAGFAGTLVTLDGSGSTDPDGPADLAAFEWKEGETVLGQGKILEHTFNLGQHLVTLTVKDKAGATSTDQVLVTVVDTTGPDIQASKSITVEQATRAGTEVTLTATATDNCDANPTLTFSHGPTAVFPLGATAVTITAADASGNQTAQIVSVNVVDTAAPAIQTKTAITVEQATRAGAEVTLTATVSDVCDAAPMLAFSHGPTAVFPLGNTNVTITATDASGNQAAETVIVKVIDTAAPAIQTAKEITVEQATRAGTEVILTATATDICDANPALVFSHGPTAVFPLGTTDVTVTSADASGNQAAETVLVKVIDTTAPSVNAGPDITVDQETPEGAQVTLTAAVADICDANPAVIFSTGPTAVFPPGTTEVTVSATDASGNTGSDTVKVTVLAPQFQKQRILDQLLALPPCPGDVHGKHDEEDGDDDDDDGDDDGDEDDEDDDDKATPHTPGQVNKEILRAIAHLRKSLNIDPKDPTKPWKKFPLYRDAQRLDLKHGHMVFDEQKHAVHHLEKVIRVKSAEACPVQAALAAALIPKLVKIDRLFALIAIHEAESASVTNPKHAREVAHKIAQAKELLAEGDLEFSKGRNEHAIEKYKEAWKRAADAIRLALQLPNDDDD